MREIITLEVSPEEARLILRAVKARAIHWSKPEQINRISNAAGIRRLYRDAQDTLEAQIKSQGVNP